VAREAAADALAAESPRLADALRARHCSLLTKADLLLLCAHWRYRGDLWRLRGNRPTRPLAAAAQDAHSSTLEPSPPASSDEVWLHIAARLRPLSTRAATLMQGAAAHALAAADAATAHRFTHELPPLAGVEAYLSGTWLPQVAGVLAGVRSFESELPLAAGATPAAHYAFPPALAVVPLVITFMEEQMGGVLRTNATRRAQPGITHAEEVWLDELRAGMSCCVELMTRMGAILALSRQASVSVYVQVASMLMDMMASHSLANLGALQQRRRWLEALPACSAPEAGGAAQQRKQPLVGFVLPPFKGSLVEAMGLSHPTACSAAMAVM
jgi:hypothetical protein